MSTLEGFFDVRTELADLNKEAAELAATIPRRPRSAAAALDERGDRRLGVVLYFLLMP
jgi:hypothetical protein